MACKRVEGSPLLPYNDNVNDNIRNNDNSSKNVIFPSGLQKGQGFPFFTFSGDCSQLPWLLWVLFRQGAITLWNFKVFSKLWKYAEFTLSEYCSKYLGIPRKRTAWEYLQVRLSMFRTPWRFISSASNISNQPGTSNKFLCPHTFFKYQCWSMPLIKYKRRSIQTGTLSIIMGISLIKYNKKLIQPLTRYFISSYWVYHWSNINENHSNHQVLYLPHQQW